MKFSDQNRDKLKAFAALLLKWQKTINLISPNTIEHIWVRHIEDSAQLAQYIPDSYTVYDLGSGGGLPACVLAILRPDLKITAIESDKRKAIFLKTAARELDFHLEVLSERIEDVFCDLEAPDMITARAFKSLKTIFDVSHGTYLNKTQFLLLKGAQVMDEISEAQKSYNFQHEVHQSVTEASGKILLVRNVIKT